jgi:hypothetical protein
MELIQEFGTMEQVIMFHPVGVAHHHVKQVVIDNNGKQQY